MRIQMTLQCKTVYILLPLFLLLFAGCGDSELLNCPVREDSEDSGNAENQGNSQEYYYPFVEGIEVSAGKGYCDVTIYGSLPDTGSHISDVQITILHRDIILIPVTAAGLKGADEVTPFKKTVHIEDLDKGRYTISIIGWRERERILITETVEIE
ncbi:MAG: hypothetical protein ACE5PV_02075 [Candidatus Poribacteria bacterium]